MTRTAAAARNGLAAIAAAAALGALLPGGSALAQGGPVRMFEEAPPLEVLRSIMVPESHGGPGRRIVLTNPDRPAPPIVPAAAPAESFRSAEPEPAPAPAPPRRAQPKPQPAAEPEQWLPPSARAPAAPAPSPVQASMSGPAPKPRAVATAAAAAGAVGYRINFALNSDAVPEGAHAFVDRIGELMRAEPGIKIQVEGHTDALGSDEYNLQLSVRRAVAVANHLVGRNGIDPSRLVVLGKGEAEPLGANAFDAGNRRVQFLRAE